MIPIRTLAKRITIGATAALVLTYAGDFLSVRVRMLHPKPGDPFETITGLRILAIEEKGGKTEYTVDQLQPQQSAECVHALFPHNGDPPCWYLKRKFAEPIPMSIFFVPRIR
ncbi:MAG: hypothetical protein WA857_19480 [Candidatus Acidiferrum sp.]